MFDKKTTAKAVIFGTLFSMLIAIILLCIVSAAILSIGLLPSQTTSFITIGCLALGIFAGSFISARIAKSQGWLIGLLTGFAVFIIVTSVGILKSNEPVSYLTGIRFCANIILGIIGGIIGVNKKEKLHIK